MINQNSGGSYISSLLVADHWLEPDDRENYLLLDYEAGPIALNDPSEGTKYQAWTLRYFPATGDFTLEAPNTAPTIVLTVMGVTEVSLAFDLNGNPFIAFVENGDAKYWWWDPTLPGLATTALPANSISPRCCTDDKRDYAATAGVSDIILCYVVDGAAEFRVERERYTIPQTLVDPFLHPVLGLPAVFKRVGMNKQNRLQWLCDLANPIDWCRYSNYG